jgi:biopolymer transport protein TolR
MGPFCAGKRGIVSDMNVVPLIDILLVLLVIFMLIPHQQMGLPAGLPQPTSATVPIDHPENLVVQVAPDGTIRLNGLVVRPGELRSRLQQVFALRAHRVAFLQGDCSLEFHAVAEVLNVMHLAGASPIGLVTPELEKNR